MDLERLEHPQGDRVGLTYEGTFLLNPWSAIGSSVGWTRHNRVQRSPGSTLRPPQPRRLRGRHTRSKPKLTPTKKGQGELGSFRTFQRQPAWQGRATKEQLRRFMGSGAGRKIRYARLLVDALHL
jgi:hypothetical protein